MRTALLLAATAVAAVNGAFVSFKVGSSIVRDVTFLNCEGPMGSLLSACQVGGAVVQLVTRDISAGSFSYNKTTYSIGHFPCPHVGAKHEFLTVSTNGTGSGNLNGGTNGNVGVGNGTLTGGLNGTLGGGAGTTTQVNVSYDSYANYLSLTHAFLYTENNSIAGAQPSEFLGALPICGGAFNPILNWSNATYNTYNYTNGTVTFPVHILNKCADLSVMVKGAVQQAGRLCFTFSIAGGDYVSRAGARRIGGEMKLDYTFVPSALLQVTNASSGIAGVFFTSSDAADASINFGAKGQVKSVNNNTAAVDANLVTTFSNGAAAYVNWVNYVNVSYVDGTVGSANVNVTLYNTTTFNAAFNVTSFKGYAASDNMVSKSIVVFSFETPLGSVANYTWDPSSGQGVQATATDPTTSSSSSKAAINANLSAGFVALVSMMLLLISNRF